MPKRIVHIIESDVCTDREHVTTIEAQEDMIGEIKLHSPDGNEEVVLKYRIIWRKGEGPDDVSIYTNGTLIVYNDAGDI